MFAGPAHKASGMFQMSAAVAAPCHGDHVASCYYTLCEQGMQCGQAGECRKLLVPQADSIGINTPPMDASGYGHALRG